MINFIAKLELSLSKAGKIQYQHNDHDQASLLDGVLALEGCEGEGERCQGAHQPWVEVQDENVIGPLQIGRRIN